MSSNSSCTYKELIDDHVGLKEPSRWDTIIVKNSLISKYFNVDSIIVSLVERSSMDESSMEESSYIEIKSIPKLMDSQIDEMVVEPLLWVSSKFLNAMKFVTQDYDVIFMSMSSYGIKHVIFSMEGCLLCADDNNDMSLYVPQIFMKKVVSDCGNKDIECDFKGSESRNIYHNVTIPVHLEDVCNEIMNKIEPREVYSMLTPIYSKGYRRYYNVDLTFAMYLAPNRRLESPGGMQKVMLIRDPRTVKIMPLMISSS